MDKVQMIKEEIRRRMDTAELGNEKWMRAFMEEGGTNHEIRVASLYKAEYSALKYLLQYIEIIEREVQ